MKNLSKLFAPLCATIMLLAFAGCSNVFSPPVGSESTPANGALTINLASSARTLVPSDYDVFNYYKLSFEDVSDGGAVYADVEVDLNGELSTSVPLPKGEWIITVEGYVTIGTGADAVDYLAAQGSNADDPLEIDYEVDATPSVTIDIFAEMAGEDGFFSYTIDVSALTFSVTPELFFGPFPAGPFVEIYDADDEGELLEKSPGFYLMIAKVSNANQVASVTEIVHIYPGRTTVADLTFTDDDFTELITLSGTATLEVDGVDTDITGYTIVVRTSDTLTTFATYVGEAEVDAFGEWSVAIAAFEAPETLYFWLYDGDDVNWDIGEEADIGNADNEGITLDFVYTNPVVTFVFYDMSEQKIKVTKPATTVGSSLPTDSAVVEYYVFSGWNTEAGGGGDVFTATTPVTADITVYAQWQFVGGERVLDTINTINNQPVLVHARPLMEVNATAVLNADGSVTLRNGASMSYKFPENYLTDWDYVEIEWDLLDTYEGTGGDNDAEIAFKQYGTSTDYTPSNNTLNYPDMDRAEKSIVVLVSNAGASGGFTWQYNSWQWQENGRYESFTVQITKITFYLAPQYNITFTNSGSSETFESRTVGEDLAIGALPIPKAVDDYYFVGWFTAGDDQITATSIVTSDLELIAKWEAGTRPDWEINDPVLAGGGGATGNATDGYAITGGLIAYQFPAGYELYTQVTFTFDITGSGQIISKDGYLVYSPDVMVNRYITTTEGTSFYTYPLSSISSGAITWQGNGASITNIKLTKVVFSGDASPLPTESWEVDFTGLATVNSGEYVGSTGIQRANTNITFDFVGNALEITLATGTYQQINLQTGTAVGGTNYYASAGFTAAAGVEYTITFNAYVKEGTGSLRIGGNSLTNPTMGGSGNWDKTFSLTTTSALCEYTWTQEADGGNLKLDTGGSATGTVFYITDLKIEWLVN